MCDECVILNVYDVDGRRPVEGCNDKNKDPMIERLEMQ